MYVDVFFIIITIVYQFDIYTVIVLNVICFHIYFSV